MGPFSKIWPIIETKRLAEEDAIDVIDAIEDVTIC